MNIVDKLKSSHSMLGDPLHREAWEEIESLQSRIKLLEGYLSGALDVVELWTKMDTTVARKALGGE